MAEVPVLSIPICKMIEGLLCFVFFMIQLIICCRLMQYLDSPAPKPTYATPMIGFALSLSTVSRVNVPNYGGFAHELGVQYRSSWRLVWICLSRKERERVNGCVGSPVY